VVEDILVGVSDSFCSVLPPIFSQKWSLTVEQNAPAVCSQSRPLQSKKLKAEISAVTQGKVFPLHIPKK